MCNFNLKRLMFCGIIHRKLKGSTFWTDLDIATLTCSFAIVTKDHTSFM